MMTDRKFAIIGAGAVGRSFAAALRARGAAVAAVASRSMGSARKAASAADCPLATTDAAAAARQADAVALCVPDGAIEAVCQTVADGGGFGRGDVAFHFSGALPSRVLAPAQAAGAGVLSFHPAQTFARPDPAAFEGVYCVLEGDEAGLAFGRELAALLRATPITVRAEDKALYHAALCIACNYLVTLADAAASLLAQAGLGDRALPALLPLLGGALDNLRTVGLPGALTGPISRGDVATLRSHLAALAERQPGLLPLYRVLALHTADLAVRKGSVTRAEAQEVKAAMEEGGG